MFLTKELLEEKHLPTEQVAWFAATYPTGVLASDMLRTSACQVDAHWLYYTLIPARKKKLLDADLAASLYTQHAYDRSVLYDFYAKTGLARERIKKKLLRTNEPMPADRQLHINLVNTAFKHRHAAMLAQQRGAKQLLYTQYFARACALPDSFGERVHRLLSQLLKRYTDWRGSK